MSEIAVVDASPIIYLAHANFLDLLRLSAPEIVVPTVVADEILARGAEDLGAKALALAPWIQRVEAPTIPLRIMVWGLGVGESAVIAWALAHPESVAVVDDLEGRRCAETLGVPLLGTLGLVLRAKRRGLIPQARPVLEVLRGAGMYLSQRIVDVALAEVGE